MKTVKAKIDQRKIFTVKASARTVDEAVQRVEAGDWDDELDYDVDIQEVSHVWEDKD